MAVHFSGRVSVQLDKVSKGIEGGGARRSAAVREHCLDETVNTSTPSSCARPRRRRPRRCPGGPVNASARIFRPPTPNNSDHPETGQRYDTNRCTIKYRFPATNHHRRQLPLVNVRFTRNLYLLRTIASSKRTIYASQRVINIGQRERTSWLMGWEIMGFAIVAKVKQIS